MAEWAQRRDFLSNVEKDYVQIGQSKNFFLIKISRPLFNEMIKAQQTFKFCIIIGVCLNFSKAKRAHVTCIQALT